MSSSLGPRADRAGGIDAVLAVTLLVTLAGSFAPLLPLAAIGALALVRLVRRRPATSALGLGTLAVALLALLDLALSVPNAELATYGFWRWHGRALVAPLGFALLLLFPLEIATSALRRGMTALAAVMGVVAIWGWAAVEAGAAPTELSFPRFDVKVAQTIHERLWFDGLFRHHEVAGGAYAVVSLYALAAFLRARSWRATAWTGGLFLACALGVAIAMARAYWGGFAVGAAVVAALTFMFAERPARRAVLVRALLVGALGVAALLSQRSMLERLDPELLWRVLNAPFVEEERPIEEMLTLLDGVELFAPDAAAPDATDEELAERLQRVLGRMRIEWCAWWDRRLIWRACWEGFGAAPWFGHGIGTFPDHFRGHPYMWSRSNAEHHAHNNLLQLGVDLGVVGTLVVLAWFASIVVAVWRAARARHPATEVAIGALGGVAALVVGGVFDTNVYAPTLMLPALVPAALVLTTARASWRGPGGGSPASGESGERPAESDAGQAEPDAGESDESDGTRGPVR